MEFSIEGWHKGREVSFHATRDPIERMTLYEGTLEIVTCTGEVWHMKADADSWEHVETIGMPYTMYDPASPDTEEQG